MAVNETNLVGRKYRVWDAANNIWKRLSFWTKASDVEMENGTNLETEISGIKSTLTDKNNLKLSTNSSKQIRFGIDSNGKYGYIKDGADTVTPFKNPSGTKNIITNGTYDVTDYSNANVNVPTGVELPNTLEFGCDHNGRANTGNGYNVGFHFSFSCNIPKFLCDNYTSFKITKPNPKTNFQADVLRTDGSSSTLTVNCVYSIASYVVSSGELKILISNGANSLGEASIALYDVKITLIKSYQR